ncbi:hypothetical protein KP509_20G015000 [Ceratopteris richardii]|uniref:Uncharacterized protein n=1 Tax=Ceratopteris richardii TaxID=49495 RepID=A0A8T2SF64_CERRI|nr:hypothetical protein KP509_20G015000 [Ceratopteris richardii]
MCHLIFWIFGCFLFTHECFNMVSKMHILFFCSENLISTIILYLVRIQRATIVFQIQCFAIQEI